MGAGLSQRGLEQLNILRNLGLTDVGDRPADDVALRRPAATRAESLAAARQIRIELRKLNPFRCAGRHCRRFAFAYGPRGETGEPLAVVGEAEADLAELAIADDVYASVGLLLDNVRHGPADQGHGGFDVA
jgi:hypothetical protein